jgi:hypothetical protein
MAECSESTGTIWPGAARRVTRSPPTMRRLLVREGERRAALERRERRRRPTDPVMPFSTTSASTSRTSCTASSMPTAVCSTPNVRRLLLEQGAIRADREPHDLEPPRVRPDDVERLGADRTG